MGVIIIIKKENMKTNFYLMPRQTGKTRTLILNFLKDPSNSYIFTCNDAMAKHVSNVLPTKYRRNREFIKKHIYGVGRLNKEWIQMNLMGKFSHCSNVTIYFDELLLYDQSTIRELHSVFHDLDKLNRINEINIYSTAQRRVPEILFDAVRTIKQYNLSKGKIYDEMNARMRMNRFPKIDISDDIDYLYYNFITDKNCNLITPKELHSNWYHHKRINNLKDILSDDDFELGCNNNMFIDELEYYERKLNEQKSREEAERVTGGDEWYCIITNIPKFTI